MDKPWLAHYGSSIPEQIDPDVYPSVVAMMLEACERYADNAAFSSFGATLSYADMARLSRDFAAYLQQLGIRKGDRVAVMSPNIMAFPVALLGILRAGAIQVNVNPLYTARELEHQLRDAEAETIVVFSGSSGVLAEVIARTPVRQVIVAGLDDLVGKGLPSPPVDGRLSATTSFAGALRAGSGLPLQPVELNSDDLIFLQYTGGTTGLSKGAMLSHRNLIANVLQYEAFAGDMIHLGEDIVITALPLYHIFALMVNTLSYFRFGATNVLITNPRDMPGFVKEWSRWPVTVFAGVNTLYNGLLHTPGFAELDFSTLRLSVGGGAPVQEAVSNRWREVTGRHIMEGYGLSETSPVLTLTPLTTTEFKGSIGIPMPSTEISLRNDDGVEVEPGMAAELCARGPQVMPGYWRQPEATREVMTEDGFFRTGDIAVMDDDGFFRIVDRKKDMILVSGFNVYPNEIEALVAEMPGVLESACIGVPDGQSGEAVKLFVVRKDESLTADQVREFCRQGLTPYKVPRFIDFVQELPKSTVGKILRRELRGR